MDPSGPFSDGSGAFSAFGTIIPIFIFAIVVFAIVSSITRYAKNSAEPLLQMPARVIAKRMEVSGTGHAHLHDAHPHMHSGNSTRTTYYVTFELNTGERREMRLEGSQYGLVVEGDVGMLAYQGEWFKGFQRQV